RGACLLVRRARRAVRAHAREYVLRGQPGAVRSEAQAGGDLALPLSARRDRAPSRRGGRRQRRFPRTARHARGADDAYHAADDGAAGRGGPHAPPALDCQPHLLLRRGERRDWCGRQALGMATRRYLRGAVLDQVRAHRRSRRTAVFDVRRATDALLPLLPVRSGLISRSISTASLTFAKMTAVRARR